MSLVVNKGLKLELLPSESMLHVLEQNIGNARFVWNNILERYLDLYKLFKFHGYTLSPTINNLNAILKMLKQENSFLYDGESTSQQQVFQDLNKAFTKFFIEGPEGGLHRAAEEGAAPLHRAGGHRFP